MGKALQFQQKKNKIRRNNFFLFSICGQEDFPLIKKKGKVSWGSYTGEGESVPTKWVTLGQTQDTQRRGCCQENKKGKLCVSRTPPKKRITQKRCYLDDLVVNGKQPTKKNNMSWNRTNFKVSQTCREGL